VSDQAAGARGFLVLSAPDNRRERVTVEIPNTDIRLGGTNSNEIVVIGEFNAVDATRWSVKLESRPKRRLTSQGCCGR
jgi:hypothetical protein